MGGGGAVHGRVCKLLTHLRTDTDATLCVAVDADGRTLTCPSKVVNARSAHA